MPKKVVEYPLLPLFRHYINQIKKGKHLQKNGKKMRPSSIINYQNVERLLIKFSLEKEFILRIRTLDDRKKARFNEEGKYWKKFYIEFTSFLFESLNHHDNYVGRMMKLIRSFFNYLINEKGMNIGFFHKKFYAPYEETDIVIVSPERLNYLIHDKEKEALLNDAQKIAKDIFVLGCCVALRYSDLMALSAKNIETINDRVYINIRSQKTHTFTKVKMPDFAVDILYKYKGRNKKTILPHYRLDILNGHFKKIMELYGFTELIPRTIHKRGIAEIRYKLKGDKETYRFCDAVSSHTMRRSAITIMLILGVNEQVVRKISGHSAGSKEFYRYVSFAQAYVDSQIDEYHEKLKNVSLKVV